MSRGCINVNYMEWATYSRLTHYDFFLVTEELLNIEREIEARGGERLTDALYYTRRFEYPWVYLRIPDYAERVLDAGGGPAIFQYLLASHFPLVHNIDLNQEWIEKVERTQNVTGLFRNLYAVQGDLSDLSPHMNDYYDTTVCISALEHGGENTAVKIVENLKRVTSGPILLTMDVGKDDPELLDPQVINTLSHRYGFDVPFKPPDIIKGRTVRNNPFEVACIKLEPWT